MHRPTVVLLDVMMPGIDGSEVCRRLKHDPETAHIRVVAMTGYHSPEVEKKMLAAGARVLLEKPFASADVLEACGFGDLNMEHDQG
jgi:CheY-like chemotaxis protein